jgi:hypothetical protein
MIVVLYKTKTKRKGKWLILKSNFPNCGDTYTHWKWSTGHELRNTGIKHGLAERNAQFVCSARIGHPFHLSYLQRSRLELSPRTMPHTAECSVLLWEPTLRFHRAPDSLIYFLHSIQYGTFTQFTKCVFTTLPIKRIAEYPTVLPECH